MNYCVMQQGAELPIRTAPIYPSPYRAQTVMEYIQFPLHGPTLLRIRSQKKVESAIVRPLNVGAVPKIENGEILLAIDRPVKLSLEINGGTEDNLLILAEEGMGGRAPEGGPVICFPAGVHTADLLTVDQDDTTVYLEEGAYVHGKLKLSHCDRVTVCGYGVISMERYPYESRPVYARCIDAENCRNLVIRDITIMDSNDWSLRILGCQDVRIDNVKIFGCRGNSDGVDVCSSQRVLVQNVFTRVWDDSLVVKALDAGDVEDVTFRRCVLWNDFARPMEVGVELRADRVHRVKFEDIDVLHMPTGYPVMGIHHGDHAVVSDITFENIRIEDAPGAQLFDLRIAPSYWNRDGKMGCIRDITFRDIRVLGTPGLAQLMSDSRLQGYDEIHDIRGVTVERMDLCGRTPASAAALGIRKTPFVQEINVVPHPELVPMRLVETEIKLTNPFCLRPDGLYEGEVSIVLRNRDDHQAEKEIWLRLSPEELGGRDRAHTRVLLQPGGEQTLFYPLVLQPGKYLAAVQSDDPQVQYSWKFFTLAWQLYGDGAQCALAFANYWGNKAGWLRAHTEQNTLVLESPLLQNTDNELVLYAALPVKRENGKVVFSVEETDYGRSPAILSGTCGLEAAPQMRCPLEVTMVFQAQPKVAGIRTLTVMGGEGTARIPLETLGIPAEAGTFWLEVEARPMRLAGERPSLRCPLTLFRSPSPRTSAHMFGICIKP